MAAAAAAVPPPPSCASSDLARELTSHIRAALDPLSSEFAAVVALTRTKIVQLHEPLANEMLQLLVYCVVFPEQVGSCSMNDRPPDSICMLKSLVWLSPSKVSAAYGNLLEVITLVQNAALQAEHAAQPDVAVEKRSDELKPPATPDETSPPDSPDDFAFQPCRVVRQESLVELTQRQHSRMRFARIGSYPSELNRELVRCWQELVNGIQLLCLDLCRDLVNDDLNPVEMRAAVSAQMQRWGSDRYSRLVPLLSAGCVGSRGQELLQVVSASLAAATQRSVQLVLRDAELVRARQRASTQQLLVLESVCIRLAATSHIRSRCDFDQQRGRPN